MSSFTFSSTIFAEFTWKNLSASQGLGFYRLLPQLEVTTHGTPSDEQIVVAHLNADLHVRGKMNQQFFLGHLRELNSGLPLVTYPNLSRNQMIFDLELDARRVEALEQLRLGGDLTFRIDLCGIANRHNQKHAQPVHASLEYRANQSTWNEVLGNMGYRRTILLEIPLSEDPSSAAFSQAVEHLSTAQTHFLHGHFREAVGACRDVMEGISVALNDDATKPPDVVKSWFEGTRDLNKQDRIRVLRRAFKLLTHPARHSDAVSGAIEWRPSDARVALIMAAGLLQLANENAASPTD